MAIVITVEDGSNVPNANSYLSIEDARTFAANRGIVLPADDDEVAVMIIKAMDYVESFGCEYQGKPTYPTQALTWPRTGAIINCAEFPGDQIPSDLKAALAQSIIAVNSGINLFPNIVPQDYVTEETVGPITTKYADPTKVGLGNMSPILTAVNAALSKLFAPCGQGFALRTIRV